MLVVGLIPSSVAKNYFLLNYCIHSETKILFRILKTSINTFLQSDDDNLQRNMSECAKMVCHGQHTYVYAQVR